MKLRNEIRTVEPKPLNEPLRRQKILNEELGPTDFLKTFYEILYGENSTILSS